MDDRSTLKMIWRELCKLDHDWRVCQGIFSPFISMYDRIIRTVHWVSFPFKSRPAKLKLRASDQPFMIRLGSSDTWCLKLIFCSNEYGRVFEHDLGSVHQIVDLGANAGYTLRLWLSRFPEVRIVAVEPDKQNLELCRKNIAITGRENQVVLIEAAAGGHTGEACLDRSEHAWSYKLADETSGRETSSVSIMTVDKILEQGNVQGTIDLLKCDIEGSEREVFRNCAGWIQRVRNMVIELHKDVYSLEELLTDLRNVGWCPKGYEVLDDRYHWVVFLWRNSDP